MMRVSGHRAAFAFLLLLSLALFGSAILWAAHDVRANDRKFCVFIGALDQAEAKASTPPKAGTFTQQEVGDLHDLRGQLGCAP